MRMLPSIFHRLGPRAPALSGARGGSESGQALVEAAIILPAMIFLLLCAIQLTQLQQARIMVEYAAFSAARTGIVHNLDNGTGAGGDDGPMHDAAVLAVLPTYGRTDSFTALTSTLARFKVTDAVLKAGGLGMVKVAVLNPVKADFAKFGSHLNGQEIDFDDMRPQAARATLLSIQVRYLYEMRVPFANKMIQAIWFATKVGKFSPGGLNTWQGWDLAAPRVSSQKGPDAVLVADARAFGVGRIADGIPGGLNVSGLAALSLASKFYLPVDAWYSMRMQSNPFVKWAP